MAPMQYLVTRGTAAPQRTGCLVVGVWAGRALSDTKSLDATSRQHLATVLEGGDLDGKPGTTLLLHAVPGVAADRVLLVGLGKPAEFDEAGFRRANAGAAKALRTGTGTTDAVSTLTALKVGERSAEWNVQQAVMAIDDAFYRFDDMKGAQAREALPTYKLSQITFEVADGEDGERGLAQGRAVADGVKLAKDLGNLPGNVCTPTYLAMTALKLAGDHPQHLSCKVLEEADMERLGMGSLLSVSRGSRQPAKLIVLEYKNGPVGEKPVALVGKGLTFDSGGISIKPGAKMDEMKFDMCGGAAVLGAFKTLAALALPINVVGVIASSENMPDGMASKPGDIVTSMAGITIEVLNTDAEGRLILCDALTYTERTFDPAVCIDMATLTGACVIALGQFPSGLFSNNPALAQALLASGEQVGDRVWQLPLWPEYDENIKSEFADIANIATKGDGGGAIIGATFLHRFTKKMKWAHLDIAGTAWTGKKATGRPVPLLAQYLADYAAGKAKA